MPSAEYTREFYEFICFKGNVVMFLINLFEAPVVYGYVDCSDIAGCTPWGHVGFSPLSGPSAIRILYVVE